MDLYEILEINSNASELEIKKAYYKLAKKYHPDKNNSIDSIELFHKIQSAYEILIDQKTRNQYTEMPDLEKQTFLTILNKIINDEIDFSDLIKYCNNLDERDINYIQNNFIDFLKKINVVEVLNIMKGFFPKDKCTNINYSESESDNIKDVYIEYYDILPLFIQKINNLDIKIELNITINDIIYKNKKKIKIKRSIDDGSTTSTFLFAITNQYIVFPNSGDFLNGVFGNLIVKLNLPNNLYWNNNIIIISKSINLYELIYGLNIIINMDESENIVINDYCPHRDGLIIELNKYYKTNYNLILKLFLNYNDNFENKEIIKKFFS
jgi:curved DNA-binding protein CbpA